MPGKQSPERLAAKEAGKSRFMAVIPCTRGHFSERWTANGRCIECRNADDDPVERRKRALAYYHRTPSAKKRIKERNRRVRGLPEPGRPEPAHCELCGKVSNKALALDHDHKSGKFRGWLCSNCNTGLGKLGDTSESIRRALAYLEQAEN